MASAKPTATTRQTGSSKSPRKPDDMEISAARWAGVGLVIVAIIAATFLAVISSSDPGSETSPGAAAEAAATAAPTAADTRLPVAQPRITKPLEMVTSEIDIPVTVQVPEEELPKRLLTLLVLRGDEELGRKKGPKDDGKVAVHVRLVPGPNELTAVLWGPGGPGPLSEPVTVTYDPDAPPLEIDLAQEQPPDHRRLGRGHRHLGGRG